MSKHSPNFKNAEKLIDKFGGVRPLARALNITASTVQGWKNRKSIPEDRTQEIIKAARAQDIDISDLIDTPSNSNNKPAEAKTRKDVPMGDVSLSAKKTFSSNDIEDAPVYEGDAAKAYAGSFHNKNARAVLLGGAALAVSIAALGFVLFGAGAPSGLHSDSGEVNQAFLEQRLSDQLGRTENLEQRLAIMEASRNTAGSSEQGEGLDDQTILTLQSQIDSVRNLLEGNESYGNLLSRLATIESEMGALSAQMQNTGFARADFQAAAMLIALGQIRDLTGRNTPFADDLVLLKQLTDAQNDPALEQAFDRLAPYAQDGILSISALQTELRGLAGDILEASIRGEDISFLQRLQMRFAKFVTITRDGTPISDLPAESALYDANQALAAGDLDAAISELRNLNPQALRVLQPWFDHAQGLQSAQNLQNILRGKLQEFVSLRDQKNAIPLSATPSFPGESSYTAPVIQPESITGEQSPAVMDDTQ